MFRGTRTGQATGRRTSLEAQLAALGRLLDARGYTADGLVVLATDGGFVVDGFRTPERGAAYSLAHASEEVTAAELAALLAQRRGRW